MSPILPSSSPSPDPAPSTPPALIPSIDQRYGSANIEKSGRIQSRQTVQFTYTVIISTFVAFLASGEKLNLSQIGDLEAVLLTAGVALFGLVFAAWIGHQDLMIGLLDSYCLALERYGERLSPPPPHEKVPCWHNPMSGWLAIGFVARFWSNHAFGLVLLGTALPNSIILFANGHKERALELFALLLTFTFLIRFIIMPRHHLSQLKWKYRTADCIFIAAILLVLLIRFFGVNPEQVDNPKLHYPYYIGSASLFLSCCTVAMYLWFERKRCLIYYVGKYDTATGVFAYKERRPPA